MSFSSKVKDEVSKIKEYDALSELLAFLRLNTSIIFSNGLMLELQTTNISVAKRFVSDLKKFYKDVEIDLLSKETNTLNRSNICVVLVGNAKKIIEDQGLVSLDSYPEIKEKEKISSYLRGAFLINGSINDPEKSQHLEIRCKENRDAIFVQHLMNFFDLNSKIGKRRNELIVYLKDSEKIQDFLYIIGATASYFEYSEILINKKVKSDVIKSINCELFNASKSLNAATKQLEEIKLLESYKVQLDDKLKELIAYRKEYIDASLTELVNIYEKDGKKATRSSLNHRFRKIHELAEEIREKINK